MSGAWIISYFIVYELLLNHAQVGALPALAAIFIMRMRCQNLRICPGRGNCHSGFVLRVSTNGDLPVNNIFLPPLSSLWLMSGMFWIYKKLSCPTHWTSLTPFPLSHTFLPLIIPLPRMSGSHANFGPWSFSSFPLPCQQGWWRKLNSLGVSFLGPWPLGCCCFLSVLLQQRQF